MTLHRMTKSRPFSPVMAHDVFSLHWTRRALSQFEAQLKHIAKDNPAAASKLARTIRTRTESLKASPFLGREIAPGLRELIVHRHYLLTYRIKQGRIEILQVWHTARQRH